MCVGFYGLKGNQSQSMNKSSSESVLPKNTNASFKSIKHKEARLKPIHQQLENDLYWQNLARDASLIEVMIKEERRDKYLDRIQRAIKHKYVSKGLIFKGNKLSDYR